MARRTVVIRQLGRAAHCSRTMPCPQCAHLQRQLRVQLQAALLQHSMLALYVLCQWCAPFGCTVAQSMLSPVCTVCTVCTVPHCVLVHCWVAKSKYAVIRRSAVSGHASDHWQTDSKCTQPRCRTNALCTVQGRLCCFLAAYAHCFTQMALHCIVFSLLYSLSRSRQCSIK